MGKILDKDKLIFRISMVLTVLAMLIAFFSFMFNDLPNTVDNSFIFIQSVRHGRFLSFYEDSVQASVTNFAANYSAITYVFFAIWQLPLYIIMRLLKIDCSITWYALLWTKLFTVILSGAVIYISGKIVKMITNDKKDVQYCTLIMMSGMFLYFPVFLESQIDALPLLFIMLGLYGYLTDNKKLFFISFMFATSIKTFCLFMTLPLLLLKEKNLIKSGLIWLSTLSLVVVERIIFKDSAVYTAGLDSQSRDAMSYLLNSTTALGRPVMSFIVAYAIIVIACILIKNPTKLTAVYISLCVWVSFFTLTVINQNWVAMLFPFTAIMIACSERYKVLGMILETISGISYLMFELVVRAIFSDEDFISRLLLGKFISTPDASIAKYGTLYEFSVQHDLAKYSSLFTTGYVIALILLAVLVNPKIQELLKKKNIGDKESIFERSNAWIIIVRPVIMLASCALIIYTFTATTNAVAITTMTGEGFGTVYGFLGDEDTRFSQQIRFDETTDLDTLTLTLYNSYPVRNNMSMIIVEIWDLTTDECIHSSSVCAAFIKSDEACTVDIDGTVVNDTDLYEIRLRGVEGIACTSDTTSVIPYVIFKDAVDAPLCTDCLRINGNPTEFYLYFEIR